MKKVGVLTGGGDCPGLNAVIRAVVVKAMHAGWQVVGLEEGWKGLLEMKQRPLVYKDVEETLSQGGTILLTSRTNPEKIENGVERCLKNFEALGLHALVAIGGEDTLGFAAKLSARGAKVVGVPKTIDNDLLGTDFTFGFDTTINIATEALDRLRTTARSHKRTMVLELMGRHAGWITTFAGIAGGADVVLTPEFSMHIDDICTLVKAAYQRGKNYCLVVIAEGATVQGLDAALATKDSELDAFGHMKLGGVAERLAKAIKQKTGFDTRDTNLGHIQRGGAPSAMDRVMATAYGLFAMDLVIKGQFDRMAVLRGNRIESEDLQKARAGLKLVPEEVFSVARHFFLK